MCKEESPWHSLVWRSSCLPQSARFGIKCSWVLGSRALEVIWFNHRFNGHADHHAVHHADFLVEKRDTREAEVMFYVKTYFSCEIGKGVLNQQEQSMYRRQQRNCAFNFCWCLLLFDDGRLNRKHPHEETGDVISSHAVAQKGQRGSKLFDSQHREECASWVLDTKH